MALNLGLERQTEKRASGLLVERHKAVIKFDSPTRSYIRNLYPQAKAFLEMTEVQFGKIIMFTKHTTAGLDLIETDEPKLLDDILWSSRMVIPADKRGSEYKDGLIDEEKFPISGDWTHNCEDNPLLPPNQRDRDRNPDKHVRAQLYGRPSIDWDIEDGVFEIEDSFKRPAFLEFDGGVETELRDARRRKVFMTIEQYARGPKTYPTFELPPYQP